VFEWLPLPTPVLSPAGEGGGLCPLHTQTFWGETTTLSLLPVEYHYSLGGKGGETLSLYGGFLPSSLLFTPQRGGFKKKIVPLFLTPPFIPSPKRQLLTPL